MAEQWTRKYRPTTMSTYVGNTQLKDEVRVHLEKDTMPQMMLFHGSAGTGKTTIARLIAKAMVCTNRQNGDACGECFQCQQLTENYILKGETPLDSSVKDFNISNMNTVEDASRIIDDMSQRGMFQDRRVFILDEVQEASPRAQASFLKIAEEPPEGIYVILCTTHPDKLAKAFKSRFISRRVQKPSQDELVDHLISICRQEGVNYSRDGLKLLVNRVGTVPRECINHAEYISSMGDITRRAVEGLLGVISFDEYIRFIEAVGNNDIVKLDSIVAGLNQKGIPVDTFIRGFGDFMITAIKAKAQTQRLLEEFSAQDVKQIRKVTRNITDEALSQAVLLARQYVDAQSEFEYFAFSFTLTTLFQTKQPDSDESEISRRATQVTRKVKQPQMGQTGAIKELTADDLLETLKGGV